jgi:CAAX protease family protein
VWLAVVELAIVVSLFVGDVYRLVPLSKTPFFFALGWASLRIRGARWRDVGLTRPRSWPRTLVIGLLAGAAMSALELLVSHPLLSRALGQPPDLSDFASLRGNLRLFVVWMLVLWVLAALGEEAVYRGYLMNRVAELAGGTRGAWKLSLVVVSAVFGASHVDQGITGMLENVINGLLLGLLYLRCGRNLVAPVVAHGVQDTVDLVLIFFGRYPGL